MHDCSGLNYFRNDNAFMNRLILLFHVRDSSLTCHIGILNLIIWRARCWWNSCGHLTVLAASHFSKHCYICRNLFVSCDWNVIILISNLRKILAKRRRQCILVLHMTTFKDRKYLVALVTREICFSKCNLVMIWNGSYSQFGCNCDDSIFIEGHNYIWWKGMN